MNPSDTSSDPWLDIFANAVQVPMAPAPSNNISPRLEALKQPLRTLLENGAPAFELDRRCKTLRSGFNHGYRWKRDRNGTIHRDKPEKNAYSHPMDALQYGALGSASWADLTGRAEQRRARAQGGFQTQYDPMAGMPA